MTSEQKANKNVFRDLGLGEEEAGLKLKSYLFQALQEAVPNSKRNQTQIAELIGADQPKVSCIPHLSLSSR